PMIAIVRLCKHITAMCNVLHNSVGVHLHKRRKNKGLPFETRLASSMLYQPEALGADGASDTKGGQAMRPTGRISVGLVFFTLAFLAIGLAPANAGSCGLTTTCTFELTHANITQLDGAIDVRVTWDNTGSATVLSVQWISGGPGTPKDISEFGYNS